MIVNELREREYLVRTRQLFQELDKRDDVKAELAKYNFGDDQIKDALTHFEAGKTAFNFLVKESEEENVERDKYKALLQKAVERVEFHTELLCSALNDNGPSKFLFFLKKPRFFYTTDEWISLAKDQIGQFMTDGTAIAALKKFHIQMSELEKDMDILVKLEEARAFYIKEFKSEYEAETDLQNALNALAPIIRAAESIINFTLKPNKDYILRDETGNETKERKEVILAELGIPFLEMITCNSYTPPPLDRMVKDSSIT